MNARFSLPAFTVSKAVFLDQNDNNIVETLLYRLASLSETQNISLNATIKFLISSNRFEEQLYQDHMNE